MYILSIETSCDETAITLLEAKGIFPNATYEILGNALWSQINIHSEYGGVFPALAKREHAAIIVSMLKKALERARIKPNTKANKISKEIEDKIKNLLQRDKGLAERLLKFHHEFGVIDIDLISVTIGPGLEPALWVGVNFAKAISLLWNKPVVPVNHMEGHILASIYNTDKNKKLTKICFPAIALLISGGHTELILIKDWGDYEKIGQTRDDAVGEAFDKVARLIGIPYPGGPEISRRAKEARKRNLPQYAKLPAPMLHSKDSDFSFSGLKTAVRYAVQDKLLNEDENYALSRDFEDVVTTVLVKKTKEAIEEYSAQTLIVGGGVSANTHIKKTMEDVISKEHSEVKVYFPTTGLSTDNSIMIALAGHAKAHKLILPNETYDLRANGNYSVDDKTI